MPKNEVFKLIPELIQGLLPNTIDDEMWKRGGNGKDGDENDGNHENENENERGDRDDDVR